MKNCRVCFGCKYYHSGVPYSHCIHPQGSMKIISDYMCFVDAGENCPLNIVNLNKTNPKYLIHILKEKFAENGIKGAVVGISGGKDSTIVAKLMVEVLGKENVFGVLMPNGEQSDISDSYRVVEFLNIPFVEVNIRAAYNDLLDSILLKYDNEITTQAAMTIPPRLRMTTLYAIAQSKGNGWRVRGTTNKSEEYIGWLTKWGDGAADFEPIIDYTVTELRELGMNLGLPDDLVKKVPIDGLAPGSDEERLGFTYTMLDNYIMKGTSGNAEVDEKIKKLHAHKRNPVASIHF